ncbi:MAG: hypothetical protein PVG24_10440 [Gammaproteobacteria bacterium]
MQRLLKFLHTIGAIGMTGAILGLIVMMSMLPEAAALAEYAGARSVMSRLAKWIFLPSLALVLVAGLLSMAVTPRFRSAGWALVKLATGIVVFEGGLVGIQGPMEREALLGTAVLAGTADPQLLGNSLNAEWGSLWLILAVAVANVALGIWRPRRMWPGIRKTDDSDAV